MLMFVSDIGTTATGTGYGWLLPALLVLCLAVIAVLAAVKTNTARVMPDNTSTSSTRYSPN